MESGTVKFYNEQRVMDFIQPDNGGKDVSFTQPRSERAG